MLALTVIVFSLAFVMVQFSTSFAAEDRSHRAGSRNRAVDVVVNPVEKLTCNSGG